MTHRASGVAIDDEDVPLDAADGLGEQDRHVSRRHRAPLRHGQDQAPVSVSGEQRQQRIRLPAGEVDRLDSCGRLDLTRRVGK